jgi:hydrogenase maturation protein HypF
VTGTVQGVGFRPFVYRQARALGLRGFVRNDSEGVLVEVEGDPAAITELCRVIVDEPPPLARVELLSQVPLRVLGDEGEGFAIVHSHEAGAPAVPVSVDVATCPACLAEVDDPGDRRHRYPFTNCTDCGPRYTIVKAVPYDRASTTMAGFVMCDACQAEYDDPASRRFHAQPNACPACGPRLSWRRPDGEAVAEGEEALSAAVDALRRGRLVAVKGIGGYHLAVDATDEQSVRRLRRRKARDDKPFALMVRDLDQARQLCALDEEGEEALTSRRRPIVLAPRRPGAAVADAVAPGLPELGLMLPYSPLHHLLLAGVGRPLVMTSGNLSDDPIAYEEDDALARLGPLVDGLLTHDRPIHVRCDDSVARATAGGVQMVRRSRGYAPEPLLMAAPARRQVLAVGAELKNTVAVAKGTWLVASHHIGDLEHLSAYRSFLQATDHLCHLYGVEPEVVAHDLHPEYLSTKWAHDSDHELLGVQHHHAHVAACLVEHGRSEPVLGVAFDGLGYGADGTLWGGEFLVADLSGYRRVGHLLAVPMPGGAAAIREPWRMALAWAAAACGDEAAARLGEELDERWPATLSLVGGGGGPVTSSVGRLFDAVAAVIGLRRVVSYEGQAAVELEALARRIGARGVAPYRFALVPDEGGPERTWVLDPRPALEALLVERRHGAEPPAMAAAFHLGLGRATAEMARQLAEEAGLGAVALSGGVFQNVLLTEVVRSCLRSAGLEVLVHRLVPPNDGGISIGQAAVAALG